MPRFARSTWLVLPVFARCAFVDGLALRLTGPLVLVLVLAVAVAVAVAVAQAFMVAGSVSV